MLQINFQMKIFLKKINNKSVFNWKLFYYNLYDIRVFYNQMYFKFEQITPVVQLSKIVTVEIK